jgi:hypothetical protein
VCTFNRKAPSVRCTAATAPVLASATVGSPNRRLALRRFLYSFGSYTACHVDARWKYQNSKKNLADEIFRFAHPCWSKVVNQHIDQ